MKRVFKYFTLAGLSGLLCLFLAIPANAQRGGHGGGGGGFHGGGGGGFHGGGGFSRGGGGFSGGRSAAPSRSYSTAPRTTAQNNSRTTASRTVVNNSRSNAAVTGRNNAVVGRGAVGTRSYVGGRPFIGGGAFAARGGYFYNRGFYGSLYYPRLGFRVGFLPYGYYPFWWGDYEFYYSNGFYYNYDNGQYAVVEPPVGAAINTLPSGAQPITINGQQYYELNGVYYLPITRDDGSIGYQIAGKDGQLDTTNGNVQNQAPMQNQGQQYDQGSVAPPAGTHSNPRIGDLINQLPQDSRKVRINGETLYVTPDDVYLKQSTDNSGNKAYTVVGVPSGE